VLEEEAHWIRTVLDELPDDAFPLLNLGSGARAVRERNEPYADRLIFQPLAARGVRVIHADIKAAEGVDVVLDFTSATDRATLAGRVGPVRTIACSNVLEHLSISPADAAAHLLDMCPGSCFVIVTVPKRFGYHPDPVDNGFRPTADELATLFSGSVVLRKADVRGPILAVVQASYQGWLRYLVRVLMPFYKPHVWWGQVTWFWRRAEVACVLVRKDEPGADS
jgi:hypothetical protein